MAKNNNLQNLSASLRELVDVIGMTATLALVERWGGVRINVPAKYRENHPLVLYLGIDAAVKLVERYAGELLEIPRGREIMRTTRNKEIHKRCLHGATHHEIALEFGITERHVRNILKGTPLPNRRQPELF